MMGWELAAACLLVGLAAQRIARWADRRQTALGQVLHRESVHQGGCASPTPGGHRCLAGNGSLVSVERARVDGGRYLRFQGSYALCRGPVFTISYRGAGASALDRLRWPKTAFDREFEVVADDEATMRQLLAPRLRRWLAAWGERVRLSSDGRAVTLLLPETNASRARIKTSLRTMFRFLSHGVDELAEAAEALAGVIVPANGQTGEPIRLESGRGIVVEPGAGDGAALVARGSGRGLDPYEGPLADTEWPERAGIGAAHFSIAGERVELRWERRPEVDRIVSAVRFLERLAVPATSAYR